MSFDFCSFSLASRVRTLYRRQEIWRTSKRIWDWNATKGLHPLD